MAPPRSRKTRETWGTPASIYLNSSLASTGNKKQHETIRPWHHLTTSRFTDSRTNAAISMSASPVERNDGQSRPCTEPCVHKRGSDERLRGQVCLFLRADHSRRLHGGRTRLLSRLRSCCFQARPQHVRVHGYASLPP